MADKAITTALYKLFPSPRNQYAELFEHQVFLPYPYALIDLPSFYLKGKCSLYAACRLSDMKMGQLVTTETQADMDKFTKAFVPD